MRLLNIKGGYITATETIGKQKPIKLKGCVYNSNHKKVRLSERFKGLPGEVYKTENPNFLESKHSNPSITLSGKSIYLGHLMSHYGHFLTETISTFWPLIKQHNYDFYVFQSFEGSTTIPSYANQIISAFNIPQSKIIVIDKTVEVQNLTIPERLVKFSYMINPNMKYIYCHLKEYILSKHSTAKKNQSLIYISRKKNSHKKNNRTILNESAIESYFESIKFNIIYIEELTFNEQVQLMDNAKIVIGFSGSALHNCVFMNKTAHLIELADSRSGDQFHPMQSLCNEISGIKTNILPFKGNVLNRKLNISFANINNIKFNIENLLALKSEPQTFGFKCILVQLDTIKLTVKSLAVILKKEIIDFFIRFK